MLPLLFALKEYPSLNDNLLFILTGFLLVCIVLGVLVFISNGISFFYSGKKWRLDPHAPIASTLIPQKMKSQEVAVVAAAVHMLIRHPHQIVSIQLRPPRWAEEGRRAIFESHKLR